MISFQHKCIFVHIGKTGGSSIEHALDPHVSIDSGISGEIGNTKLEGKHWTALEYSKKYPKEYKEYFTFSFVRNPWDRTVSHYEWKIFMGNLKLSFAEWIESPMFNALKLSYADMICDHKNSIIVDFVGRFEELQQDFNFVCDKIGIEHIKLSHKNKIDRKHYFEYYDEKTKKIVEEKYARDIEHFGYEFNKER